MQSFFGLSNKNILNMQAMQHSYARSSSI